MAEVTQLVFFDFEMLCSESGMLFENMEAIRLGAVKYDLQTENITFFDLYIKPQQSAPLSNFCKNLTHIEDNDLAFANDFSFVFDQFLQWVGIAETRFYSWSANDHSRLKLDSLRNNIPASKLVKISNNYCDFQKIFSKRVSKNNLSVENALALYDLEFEGQMHNPMYDAYNTLRIYLAFSNELLKTDLIMLNQFIFTEQHLSANHNINVEIKTVLKTDIQHLFADIQPIANIRNGAKLLKRTRKLVKKYENILHNRGQLFDGEVLMFARLIVEFYQEFQKCYQEHFAYDCKVIILHEHMMEPLQKIAV